MKCPTDSICLDVRGGNGANINIKLKSKGMYIDAKRDLTRTKVLKS